jgi:transposase
MNFTTRIFNMIRKKSTQLQSSFWIACDDLQVKPQILFYTKLNSILEQSKFGEQVRKLCQPYYSDKTKCRPPIDPEVYFKMLIIAFFENLRSERAIAARCADSLSIRNFLGYSLTESTPDHSTLSLTRYRLPVSIFSQIFGIVLKALKDNGLVKGKNLALDTSVMEANASLQLLKNRMTEECYAEYIKELARQSGVNPEDKAAIARFDRKREGRKTSNQEWYNPHDPDAKIGKTKDGATDMIYKPEHVVDLDTGAIIDADVLLGDRGDTDCLSERVVEVQIRLNDISDNPVDQQPAETITADKGYYNVQEITEIQSYGFDTVIPDKDFKRNMSKLSDEEALAVELAHSSISSKEGKALLKRRGSHVERSFAHVLDCGGERRTTLRGINNNRKRYLIATACYNLSLLMRTIFGVGTPKQLLAGLNLSFILLLKSILWLQNQLLAFLRMIFFLSCQRTLNFKFAFTF